MRSRLRLLLSVSMAAVLFLSAAAVEAQNQLDTMLNTVQFASSGWLGQTIPAAQKIYGVLLGFEIVLTVFVWAYLYISGKLSVGGVLATSIQKIILVVFFSLTLSSFPVFLPKILATFQQLGGQVAGVNGLSPTSVLDQGILLASAVSTSANTAGLLEIPAALTALVVCLALLVCFTLLAWNLTSVLIEAQILLGGGILFMGFASNRITVQLAENYIVSLVRLGIRSYLLYFMVAVGNQLVPIWGAELTNYLFTLDGFALLFRIAAEVLIFTLITIRLPARLATELTAPAGFLHLRQALAHNY
jgi:P-type conjugative transfer protein TrbL